MAAAGSASIEPKFPCPWIRGYLKEKSCSKHHEVNFDILENKVQLTVAKQIV